MTLRHVHDYNDSTSSIRVNVIYLLAVYPLREIISVCDFYEILENYFNCYHLSAWVKYYYRILQTHHARTYTHTRTHPPTTVAVQVDTVRWVGAPNHDEVNAPFSPVPLAMNGRSVLHSNKQSRMRHGIRDSFGCFSGIQICLGRTETRTRDRMCFQSIRTV